MNQLRYPLYELMSSDVSLFVPLTIPQSLPPDVGDLQLVREINLACNKLDTIPPQVP